MGIDVPVDGKDRKVGKEGKKIGNDPDLSPYQHDVASSGCNITSPGM